MGGAAAVMRVSVSWGLQARLWLARLGVANILAVLACAAGVSAWLYWLYWLPQLRARVQEQQRILPLRLAQMASDGLPPAPSAPVPATHGLASFYEALGDARFTEQQIKTMFAIAGDLGLRLDRAQYKSAADGNGRFQTYQIILPVKAGYGQLRQFSEQMLASLPFAALDEMSLRRDAIGQPALDAQLRFTLFLAPTRQAAAADLASAAQARTQVP